MRPPLANRSRQFALALVLLALESSGCRSKPPPTQGDEACPARVTPSAPSASAAPAPSARVATEATSVAPPAAAPALARARKLQSEGNREAAAAAFVEAAGTAEKLDLRAVVEHAWMVFQQDAEDENLEVEFLAGTGSEDRELAAQSWYNLSRLHAARKRLEAERAALTRSLALRDNSVVRQRLAGRSTCVLEVGTRSLGVQPQVVSGWEGVCEALSFCFPGEQINSKEARKRACVECSMSAAEPDKSHGCAGDGPWTASFGYLHFSYSTAWIAPLGNERFFVSSTREGSWPAICRGSSSPSWEQVGGLGHVTLTAHEMVVLRGRSVPQGDPENGGCVEAPETVSHGVYELATGKLLAAFQTSDGSVGSRVDVTGRRVSMQGGGCDGHMPLDGSMRWVPSREGDPRVDGELSSP